MLIALVALAQLSGDAENPPKRFLSLWPKPFDCLGALPLSQAVNGKALSEGLPLGPSPPPFRQAFQQLPPEASLCGEPQEYGFAALAPEPLPRLSRHRTFCLPPEARALVPSRKRVLQN